MGMDAVISRQSGAPPARARRLRQVCAKCVLSIAA